MITLGRVAGVATVQDLGRRGFVWAGVPPGGALVPELLAAANARVGNPDDAAGIELLGGLTFTSDHATATHDLDLPPGAHSLSPAPRIRYLAVAGGLDTAPSFGGRGVSWQAGIGRPLRAGDTLPVGASVGPGSPRPPPAWSGPVLLLPGPDPFPPDTWDALLAGPWRVGPSDRVGLRLVGPTLPSPPRDRSAPMVRGAVQVPPDGQPVVLGPDHPTTGGYPVIAVVASSSWGHVGAHIVGDEIVFGT